MDGSRRGTSWSCSGSTTSATPTRWILTTAQETLKRLQASWPEMIGAPRPLEGPESLYLLSLVFCHGTRLDEDPDCRHYEFGDESDLELTAALKEAGLWEPLTNREVAGLTPGEAGPRVEGEPSFGWLARNELELAHRLPDVARSD